MRTIFIISLHSRALDESNFSIRRVKTKFQIAHCDRILSVPDCVGLAEEMAVESEREEGCVAERQQLEAQVKQLKGQVSEQEDVQETVATLERRIQEAQSRTSAGNDQEQEDLEDKLHRVNR